MFRTLSVRGLILILVLALGAPLASAAGSREREDLSVHGVLSALWETFTGFLSDSGLTAVFTDGDPSGTTSGGTGGSGPGMDPNGKPTGP